MRVTGYSTWYVLFTMKIRGKKGRARRTIDKTSKYDAGVNKNGTPKDVLKKVGLKESLLDELTNDKTGELDVDCN